MPCLGPKSPIVVIVSRKEGISSYTIELLDSSGKAKCCIDMYNKWILAAGVLLQRGPTHDRVTLTGGVVVAYIVLGPEPSSHPDQLLADHANSNTLTTPLQTCIGSSRHSTPSTKGKSKAALETIKGFE